MDDDIIRDKAGKFLVKPKQANVFDSKSGRAAAIKRWNDQRTAGEVAVIDKGKELGLNISDAAAAFAAVLAHHFELLMKAGKADIYQVREFRKMLSGADSLDLESQRTNASGQGAPGPGMVAASPDVLLELVRLLETELEDRKNKAAAINGQVTSINGDIKK